MSQMESNSVFQACDETPYPEDCHPVEGMRPYTTYLPSAATEGQEKRSTTYMGEKARMSGSLSSLSTLAKSSSNLSLLQPTPLRKMRAQAFSNISTSYW